VFEIVCLTFIFALMAYLIRRGVDVSYALVAGTVVLALFFGIQWGRFPRGLASELQGIAANSVKAAVDPGNLELLGLVLLIQFLGHALKHTRSLERLIAALKALLADRRAAMAVAPAFIGLLPMPGGALFSAPMVGELTHDLEVPREDRTLINYWFRHVWEWTWPLYPGILFAATIAKAPLGRVILAQAPLTLAAIVIGIFACFRRVRLPAGDRGRATVGTWRELLAATWPVLLVIALTAALGAADYLEAPIAMPGTTALLIALAIANPLFLILKRVPWREAAGLVRQTLSIRLIVLVYGVVAFGHMLRAYGAARDLPATFAEWGVPPLVLMFSVPLLVGLLTGYMPAVVGICFPVLLPLMIEGAGGHATIHYGRLAFAYAGGLFGVLLSPVHLCLVLSREYFEADFALVYRRLAPLIAVMAAAALGTLALWEAVGLR
jgi:hypothetical protein